MSSREDEAESAENAGDFERALVLWKELASDNDDPAFFCRAGLAAEQLERWADAEDAYKQALRLDSTNGEVLEGLGSLFLTRTDGNPTEQLQQAREWFERALRINRSARLLTFLGAAYEGLEDRAAARQAFSDALLLDPAYEEAALNLALLQQGDNEEEARKLMERAIELDPNYSRAHQELGKLIRKQRDPLRAEYHFRRCIEIDPFDYWSHLYLADTLAVQARDGEAEQEYRAAIALCPSDPAGIDFFARFLEGLSRTEEAAAVRATKPPEP